MVEFTVAKWMALQQNDWVKSKNGWRFYQNDWVNWKMDESRGTGAQGQSARLGVRWLGERGVGRLVLTCAGLGRELVDRFLFLDDGPITYIYIYIFITRGDGIYTWYLSLYVIDPLIHHLGNHQSTESTVHARPNTMRAHVGRISRAFNRVDRLCMPWLSRHTRSSRSTPHTSTPRDSAIFCFRSGIFLYR
jgi:hypothetical protein